MRYAIDAEFIDTPTCSALISFAIVREDGGFLYFEFVHPAVELTPWLTENVVPHLTGNVSTFREAARQIEAFVKPGAEFWAYYGAHDWYWLCRLFGGLMHLPKTWPHRFEEYAEYDQMPKRDLAHSAIVDANALIALVRAL